LACREIVLMLKRNRTSGLQSRRGLILSGAFS